MADSKKTPEAVEAIMEGIARGESLRKICNESDLLPAWRTVHKWVREDPEFGEQYRLARQEQAHHYFERIKEIIFDETRDRKPIYDEMTTEDEECPHCKGKIARRGIVGYAYDKVHLSRVRLIVDSLKWTCGKLWPRVYGEAARVEVTGKDGVPFGTLTDEQIDQQIAARIGVDLETLKLLNDKEIQERIH